MESKDYDEEDFRIFIKENLPLIKKVIAESSKLALAMSNEFKHLQFAQILVPATMINFSRFALRSNKQWYPEDVLEQVFKAALEGSEHLLKEELN